MPSTLLGYLIPAWMLVLSGGLIHRPTTLRGLAEYRPRSFGSITGSVGFAQLREGVKTPLQKFGTLGQNVGGPRVNSTSLEQPTGRFAESVLHELFPNSSQPKRQGRFYDL
jgi:hypothetical protein